MYQVIKCTIVQVCGRIPQDQILKVVQWGVNMRENTPWCKRVREFNLTNYLDWGSEAKRGENVTMCS